MKRSIAIAAVALLTAGCQTSSNSNTAGTDTVQPLDGSAASVSQEPAVTAARNAVAGQCQRQIAGPPPKPARGSDFARNAVGNNIKRNVGRNAITMIGGRLGGGLGSAVASGIATSTIRTEQDLKGVWAATDGASTCGCEINFSSGVSVTTGQGSDSGRVSATQCRTAIAGAARWNLSGYSFTGYDTTLKILAADRRTVLATLNREGINYFQGTQADGTPIVLWRRGG